jgi:DNA-directed RNA polymerase alpha subunit
MDIKKIIELTPIQVKKILVEHLEKNGVKVRNVKFSPSGVIVYITDSGKVIVPKNKKLKTKLENIVFFEIGCSIKICNCLKAENIVSLLHLEVFLQKQISEHLNWTSKEALLNIRGMGKGSYNELINLLELKNLRITDRGVINHIS